MVSPASFELKVYLGVVSLRGVVTAVTSATVGATVSITNCVTDRALLVLLALSVTLMVQLLYVPSGRALKVILLVPTTAAEVVLSQPPEYVTAPASLELKL